MDEDEDLTPQAIITMWIACAVFCGTFWWFAIRTLRRAGHTIARAMTGG